MSKKFTSTVAGASILLTGIGLLGRGLGLIREVVFAGSFGLSKQYDLFLVGTVIPLTINTIVIYIAQNYFIPVYNRLKSDSLEQARVFLTKTVLMFVLGGIFVMCLMFLLSNLIIKHYLNYPDLAETAAAIKVLRIYALTIPFNAAFAVLAAFLYSEFNFKLPSFSQLFVNVSIIIGVFIFSDSIGVISIAVGYLIGIILQLMFITFYIFRSRLTSLSLKGVHAKFFFRDSGILLIILIEALSQIYLVSDRYFLTQVDKGGIAALNYSMNIFLLPITIISVALSTALFPTFSKSYVENNLDQIKARLSKFFSLNLYLFVPLTFVFVFFGDVIIRLLFQRGAFSSADSLITFKTLKYFSISLIFYSSYAVLNKLMYSLELIKQLLIITIAGCSLKVIFNFILVSYLKQDGLALSSSLSYFFFFGTSLMMIVNRLHFNIQMIFFQRLLLLLINSFLAYIISSLLIFQFYPNNFIQNLVQLVLFIIIYLVNSYYYDKNYIRIFVNLIGSTKNELKSKYE